MSVTIKEGSLPKPYSSPLTAFLLLDEIEKAHEDVYNILLQVMGSRHSYGLKRQESGFSTGDSDSDD